MKYLTTLALFVVSVLSAQAATMTLTLYRNNADQTAWNQFAAIAPQAEQQYAPLETLYGVSLEVTADADRLDFVFTSPGGWAYGLYKELKVIGDATFSDAVAQFGISWEVSVEGEFDESSNPWSEISWFGNVFVLDTENLFAEELGYVFAPNWQPEGSFWAYFHGLSGLEWAWVAGGGFLWDSVSSRWCWNLPNSTWFYIYGDINDWVSLQ